MTQSSDQQNSLEDLIVRHFGVTKDRHLDEQQLCDFEDRVSESIQPSEQLVSDQPNTPQFQHLLHQLRHKHGTLLSRLSQNDQAEKKIPGRPR